MQSVYLSVHSSFGLGFLGVDNIPTAAMMPIPTSMIAVTPTSSTTMAKTHTRDSATPSPNRSAHVARASSAHRQKMVVPKAFEGHVQEWSSWRLLAANIPPLRDHASSYPEFSLRSLSRHRWPLHQIAQRRNAPTIVQPSAPNTCISSSASRPRGKRSQAR